MYRNAGAAPILPAVPIAALAIVAAVLAAQTSTAVPSRKPIAETVRASLVVYSGTPSGVMAAVAASRQGTDVVLLEPRARIGGMISGGLVKTDIGSPTTIGGLTREFFDRVLDYYVATYGEDSEQVRLAVGNRFDTAYFFEPKVGQLIMEQMLAEAGVKVVTNRRIIDIALQGTEIKSIVVEDPQTGSAVRYAADMFIDAGYEGDLMAAAHVPYRVGREAREEYGESLAGINMGHPESIGKGDQRVQAYNYRTTITNRDDLRVPFPRPDAYDPEPFVATINQIKQNDIKTFRELFETSKTMEEMHGGVNGKFDFNRGDLPGVNYTYPDGSYTERTVIEKLVRDSILSYLYMLQNDPRISEEFRRDALKWGLPKDEHVDSSHFPDQIYLREGRRMLGRYVLNQHDVEYFREKPDIICQGSYNMDCHVVQNLGFVGRVKHEGEFNHSTDDYAIPYRAITPVDHPNLLVSICISATHVAYSSVRMEPVYMMLGESAGIASHLAVTSGTRIQEIDVAALQSKLRQSGIPMDVRYRPTVSIVSDSGNQVKPGEAVDFSINEINVKGKVHKAWWNFDGSGKVHSTDLNPTFTFDVPKVHQISLLVEDQYGNQSRVMPLNIQVGTTPNKDIELEFYSPEVEARGNWQIGRYGGTYWRRRWHDGGANKGSTTITYRPVLPRSGRYLIAMAYHTQPHHATNVPVTIHHADGESTVKINQQTADTLFPYKSVGEFRFKEGREGWLTISNRGTEEGREVSVNNVRWIWLGE